MVALDKSQVSWLRYQPAADESFRRVMELARDVLPPMLGFYVVEHMRSGIRVVDMLFVTKSRVGKKGIRDPDLWKRKRARGLVVDSEQCRHDECPKGFVRRWAQTMNVNCCVHTAGSPFALSLGLEEYRRLERMRVRNYRRSH